MDSQDNYFFRHLALSEDSYVCPRPLPTASSRAPRTTLMCSNLLESLTELTKGNYPHSYYRERVQIRASQGRDAKS